MWNIEYQEFTHLFYLTASFFYCLNVRKVSKMSEIINVLSITRKMHEDSLLLIYIDSKHKK